MCQRNQAREIANRMHVWRITMLIAGAKQHRERGIIRPAEHLSGPAWLSHVDRTSCVRRSYIAADEQVGEEGRDDARTKSGMSNLG